MRAPRWLWASLCWLWLAPCGVAGTIETDFLQRPWPKQWVQTFEVGRDEVVWRQRASRRDGAFASVRFNVPLERHAMWEKTADFTAIGRITPGVTAVRFLEQQPNRQVIQLDVQVLWKSIQLTFEIEQDPPNAMRFRLVNEALGEYRGICWMEDPPPSGSSPPSPGTVVELATWLKPSRPVPLGLLLLVERMTFLQGVKSFLESYPSHQVGQQRVTAK